jgi:hypothetical protein
MDHNPNYTNEYEFTNNTNKNKNSSRPFVNDYIKKQIKFLIA